MVTPRPTFRGELCGEGTTERKTYTHTGMVSTTAVRWRVVWSTVEPENVKSGKQHLLEGPRELLD